ncbi:hypothetical protein EDC04DRAFT_2580569 [Pisolithus marmoratus]|nr:hypothetical protein EDC04DRAFT_2580569 [Pisolithus marmoratus]
MSRNTTTTSLSIPTPSTPTNPQAADDAPNEAFEALINLLASDGIDDVPPTSVVSRTRNTAGGAALRDASGKLDFEKIRSMFEGQNQTSSQAGAPVGTVEPDQQVLNTLGGGVQTGMVIDRRDSVRLGRLTFLTFLPSLIQLPCKQIPLLLPYKIHHRIQPHDAVHSNDASPVRDVLTTPFSFDQLNDALESAHDEMRTLRRQYDELQTLVAERLGEGKKHKGPEQKVIHKVESEDQINGSKTGKNATAPFTSRVAQLSEDEAKRALTVRIFMTNVRPSLLLSGDLDSAPFKLALRTRANTSFQDISRALDFVERIDEIVWRRSSIPISSSLDPVFSAGNVDGLVSRLKLWEKIVRSSGS